MNGHPIIKDVKKTMQKMREKNGGNRVNIEMSAVKQFGIESITQIAYMVYNEGDFIEAMHKVIFITIPKQPGILLCNKQGNRHNEPVH